MEPRLRASPEQFSMLLEFMERHGDLSRPQQSSQGRLKGERMWSELASLLNSLGGGVQKTPDKWKKVWADWKSKTKKKCLGIRQQANSTGGGPSNRQCLTALEERVIAIIGLTAVAGQAGIQEHGFNTNLASEAQLNREDRGVSEFVSVNPQNSSENNITPPITHLSGPPSPPPLSPAVDTFAVSRSPPPSPQNRSVRCHPQQAAGVRRGRGEAGSPRTRPRRTPASPRTRPRQASASPQSIFSPRRTIMARRNRGMTPFDRAANEFVAVEKRRLEHEEARDQRLHEREMERLRVESQRVEVAREQNHLLNNLCVIGNNLIAALTQQHSLPSTEIISNHSHSNQEL